ncbi:MAG: type IV secretory system conjugative DNA transfer family protein, partial [bacterium]|nr:type IV secretory system conjugative DNA transfer family protein [bacterium]
DVVYFNPADVDYPIGFNILESVNPAQKHLIASGLMGIFKKIWPDVWSARMEYILNNTILALMDFPGTTLLGINRMLAEDEYRKRVVRNVKDPIIKSFWQTEFANYDEKYRREAVAPIQNKIGQFLSASVIRNLVAQVKSRINIREIMDTKKIFIMNLSKGRIGEDNSRLLGGMLITKIQLAAMERVDIPEKDRKDFFLYVDEFQNFATESFANILSEARKYRLGLILAHQYMEQLEEEVLAAVIGNVGTLLTFRVGSTDAEILAKEFAPTFIEEDLVNLPKFQIYLKLMIDGIASRPFSAMTLPSISIATGSEDKVIRVSRERYAVARDQIEDKIARWSGMVVMPDDDSQDSDDVDIPDHVPPKPQPPKPIYVQPLALKKEAPVDYKTYEVEPKTVLSPASQGQPIVPNVLPSQQNIVKPITNFSSPGGSTSGSVMSNSNKKRSRNRNKNKSAMPTSSMIKPVVIGDPSQKGISLSDAMHTREPLPVQQLSKSLEEPKQQLISPEPPKPPMPVVPINNADQNAVSDNRQRSSGTMMPGTAVKIDE